MIPKHFKLKNEHPHSYEIQDERDGKSFQIAKHGLDLDMHGKLSKIQKLADGGKVEDNPESGKSLGSIIGYPGSPKDIPKPHAYSAGGKVRHYDGSEGSEVEPEGEDEVQDQPSQDLSVEPVEATVQLAANIPNDNGIPSVPSAPLSQPKSLPVPGGDEMGSNYLEQEKANTAIGAAQQNQYKQDVQASSIAKIKAQDLEETRQQQYAEAQQREKELAKAIAEGKVDTNRWWNNKSTGDKIAAGIGMLFSGIGSGLTGKPNMALEVMNDAINRDIDAQKHDISNKTNLWKMNREAMGSDSAANLATQNQIYTGVQHQIMQHAAQAGGQIAAQTAIKLNSNIELLKNQNNAKWAAINPKSSQAAAQGSEGEYANHLNALKMWAPEMYKDAEAKYIPGVGTTRIASTPAEKDSLTAYDNLDKAIDDAKNFQQQEGTTYNPFGTASGIADQKRDAMLLQLKQLDKNRPNENVWKAYEKDVPGIGAFNSSKTIAMLDEMKKNVANYKKSLQTHLGVQPFKQANQDALALQWAKDNINGPKSDQAMEILQRNGVK